MKRKFTAIITLLCFLCAAGCSGSTDSTETTTAAETTTEITTTAKTEEITTTTETEETTTSATETKASSETTTETSTVTTTSIQEVPEENADIIAIAEKGYTAIVENDYENIVRYVNMDAAYYFAEGEWLSDEQIVETLKATEEYEQNIFSIFSSFEDMEFLNAKQLSEKELIEYNEFIQTLDELEGGDGVDYEFTDAYRVYLSYSNMSESEKAMIGTDNAVHMLVVEARGEWKLDFYVSLLKEFYDSLVGLGETEETTDVMTVGDDTLGYLEIPEDWNTFFDPSTYGMNSLQYCSPDAKSIITMVSYDYSMVENGLVTENALASLDPYSLATNSYSLLVDSGYQSVTAATVTLDGKSCYQVYGYIDEGDERIMMVTWFFEGDDGYARYLCFEAPWDDATEVCSYIEDSYHLN